MKNLNFKINKIQPKKEKMDFDLTIFIVLFFQIFVKFMNRI